MKKSFSLIIFILIFTFLFTMGTNMIKANAAITYFSFVTTNPSEDTSTNMNISWHSKFAGSKLEYTLVADKEFANAITIAPTEEEWSTQGQANADKNDGFYTPRYRCQTTLTGLTPRTRYMYRCVFNGNYSDVHYFTTSGLTNTWNFMAFVDFQNPNNKLSHSIINTLYSKADYPSLAVCSGDLTGCGGYEADWNWLLNNSAFNNFIFASAPGDHEYWATDSSPVTYFNTPYTFNGIFNNPKNGSSNVLNTNYYFYYNNVLFIMLDMNDSNTSSGSRFTEQEKWFDETMKKLAGTYQYSVVMYHKSVYGSTTTDSGVRKYISPKWYPLFDKYNIDLAISGHDHMYSRTKQLAANKVSTDELVGTYYLDMGSSGNKYREPSSDLTSDGLHETVINLKEKAWALGAKVSVNEESMKVEVYNNLGDVVDSFEIKTKREVKEISLGGFDEEKFIEEMQVDVLNGQNKSGKLSFTSADNLRYVENIKMINKNGDIVCDAKYNVNNPSGINLTNLSGLNYDVYVTFVDGSIKKLTKTIDAGALINLKVINEDEELYIKFTKEVYDISKNVYKLYRDDEFDRDIDESEINAKKVKLKFDDIVGNHKYVIKMFADGNPVHEFECSYQGYFEPSFANDKLEIKAGNKEIIEFYFDEGSLVSLSSSDENILVVEGGYAKAIKAGEAKVILTINGTELKYELPVTVIAPEKTGCNAGLNVKTLITYLGIGVCTIGIVFAFAFRKRKED